MSECGVNDKKEGENDWESNQGDFDQQETLEEVQDQ